MIDFFLISTDVYLMLGTSILSNNSIVTMYELSEIINSEGVAQLFCVTDNMLCCNQTKWEFPNGTIIPNANTSQPLDSDIYVTSETQKLALNIPSGIYPPNGIYHCEVPDGRSLHVCWNIYGFLSRLV